MNTQEIIDKLTKNDRLVIQEYLRVKYCQAYMNYMFRKKRNRTPLFRKTVKAYWKSKQELTEQVTGFIYEFNNKQEEELA